MHENVESAGELRSMGAPECARVGCETVEVFGTTMNSVTLQETLEAIDRRIEASNPGYIVTPNVDHICLLEKDAEFRSAYREAFLVLPDSTPLMWAARLLGQPMKQKLSGSDLVYWLSDHAAKQGHSLFLLGAAPGIAEAAGHAFEKMYPGTKIAGFYSPPLGFEKDDEEIQRILEMLREAKPDICYVALGAPKQDFWNYRYSRESGVPVSLGIGASLDFVTGNVKRAPVWMQVWGLEWFWRFFQEPRRLWHRYFVRDRRFFTLFLGEYFGKKRR